MKRYDEIEPIPHYVSPSIWPMIGGWAFGMAGSFAVNIPLHTGWGFLFYLPFVVLLPRLVVQVFTRSRRHSRELDAWDGRMRDYYNRPFNVSGLN